MKEIKWHYADDILGPIRVVRLKDHEAVVAYKQETIYILERDRNFWKKEAKKLKAENQRLQKLNLEIVEKVGGVLRWIMEGGAG